MPMHGMVIEDCELRHQCIESDCTAVIASDEGWSSNGEILDASHFEAKPLLCQRPERG